MIVKQLEEQDKRDKNSKRQKTLRTDKPTKNTEMQNLNRNKTHTKYKLPEIDDLI